MLLHTNNILKQPVISLDARLKENDKKLYQEMKNEWNSLTKVTLSTKLFQLQLVQKALTVAQVFKLQIGLSWSSIQKQILKSHK